MTKENSAKKRIPIGLQLYSVRQDAAKSLEKALARVAEIGYEGVEFAGYFGHSDPVELRKLVEGYGLKISSSHVNLQALLGEQFFQTVDLFHKMGCRDVILGHGLADACCDNAGNQITAWLMNELARKAEREGLRISYHAHGSDFKIVPGQKQTAWDLLFERTDDRVLMQMDVGNCLFDGGDPYASMTRFAKRNVLLHVKPGGPEGTAMGEPEDNVDWDRIFSICESGGKTEWYIVEQERRTPDQDSFAIVARCYEYLRKRGMTKNS